MARTLCELWERKRGCERDCTDHDPISNVETDKLTTSEGEKTYMEVIKHYYDMGHEVASHTYEHKELQGLSEQEIEYQMNTESDIIFKAIGKR